MAEITAQTVNELRRKTNAGMMDCKKALTEAAGDMEAAIKAAIVNKRAGGQGLISGRKAFQRPFAEGVEVLHAIQDVYLDDRITLA